MLNIVLIDDEQIVLQGMQYALAKHPEICKVVGTANRGEIGIELINKMKPDVVITDIKMPDMDGIKLIKNSKEYYPDIYFVILSGYADFGFAKDAVRYGAYEYLLKPCKQKDILDLLQRITVDKQKKRHGDMLKQELVKDLAESKLEIRRRQIINYMVEKNDENINITYKKVRTIVVKYNSKLIKDKEFSEIAYTQFSNILEKNNIEIIQYKSSCIFILSGEYKIDAVKEQCYFLKLEVMKRGAPICGGISDQFFAIEGLREAYKQCNKIIKYLEFNEIFEVLDSVGVKKYYAKQSKRQECRNINEDYLIKNIFQGHVEVLERELNAISTQIISHNGYYDPNIFRMQVKQFMILIEKKLKEKQLSMLIIFGREVESIYEIERITNYRQLVYWCKNMLVTICRYIKSNKVKLPVAIQDAINYIDLNFYKDLSMAQIAEYVHLNQWYFSDLFKEKMEISFSDYITNIRIDHAKELLIKTSLKNYEIAEKVGFRNATYFNSVFKKREGMTPKAYRKAM